MPRGHPKGYMPVEAIRAAAAKKHAVVVARLAAEHPVKRCPGIDCDAHTLPLTAFSTQATAPDGRNGLCRGCANAYKRRWLRRRKQRERQAALTEAWEADPVTVRAHAYAENVRRTVAAQRAREEALADWYVGRGPHPDADVRGRLEAVVAARDRQYGRLSDSGLYRRLLREKGESRDLLSLR